jgi:hypothetical protein
MPDDNADLSSPGGSASPGPGAGAQRLVELLSDAESLELLASGGLGRLVYNSRYGLTLLTNTAKYAHASAAEVEVTVG